ncbi:MAG: mycofactocin biosynthesis glycosyltransferase MftF [Acidimicrobiales bacterium]
MTPALPPTWRVVPDAALRTRDDGTSLIGGTPLGIVRLSPSGAATAASLFRGEPIGQPGPRADLARRLLERGMVHPQPPGPGPGRHDVTVIVPVRGDQHGVERTLAALPPVAQVIVVDDASATPIVLPSDLASSPSKVVRCDTNLGPGGARTRGLAEADTDLVLFVDADVELEPGALDTLLEYLDDDAIVAVGPRIMDRAAAPSHSSPPLAQGVAQSVLADYEAEHSPLDLGPRPSAVRPGALVSYLPTACLLVRRRALGEVGPFDPELRFGEDVDLVWRLRSIGTVRYVPQAIATHPHRPNLTAFVRQRVGYGSSAGPLARRHGAAVAPLRSSGWTLLTLALALGGRNRLAALLHLGTTKALVPKLGPLGDPLVEAARMTTTGNVWAARTVARNAGRVWWPVVALALAVPATRPIARRWMAWSLLERTIGARETDPRQVAMGLLDDAAYGTGVWVGALKQRTLVPLLPALSGQSTSGRLTIKSSSWTTSRVSTLRRRIWAFKSS